MKYITLYINKYRMNDSQSAWYLMHIYEGQMVRNPLKNEIFILHEKGERLEIYLVRNSS